MLLGGNVNLLICMTGWEKSVRVSEIGNRNSQGSDLTVTLLTFSELTSVWVWMFSWSMTPTWSMKSLGSWQYRVRKRRNHICSLQQWVCQQSHSLCPSHRLIHVNICFRLWVRWNNKNAISPKSPSVPWRTYRARQHHLSPQSGGNLSVVKMDIDKQPAESNDAVNQYLAPQGSTLGPDHLSPGSGHSAWPLGSQLLS